MVIHSHDSRPAQSGIGSSRAGVPAVLCPDMTFGLEGLGRRGEPEVEVLRLCRSDFEGSRVLARLGEYGVPVTDWIEDTPSLVRAMFERLDRLDANHPRRLGWMRATSAVAFDYLARERLARGMRILHRARAVISDRLHGHILCVIAGIPHVIVDTRYGKVRRFHAA